MPLPSSKELLDAILTNSYDLVKLYLKQGVDPNTNLASAVPWLQNVREEDGGTHVDKDCFLAKEGHTTDKIYSLHVAVLNCYLHYQRGFYEFDNTALKILNLLLEHGARPRGVARGAVVCNVKGYHWRQVEPDSTALQLAVLLRKMEKSGQNHGDMMKAVIKALSDAEQKSGQHAMPAMAPVPKSVLKSWKKMLLSNTFSDVTFVCPDGTEIPAHKCILAASSPYFEAYFNGPWSRTREHQDGTWKTTNSPEIMKAALSFMYTGEISTDLVDTEGAELLRLASEYQLPTLVRLSEASCIRKLSIESIKNMLQLASLHNSKRLKDACFEFVSCNAKDLLTEPGFFALSTEDPELWAELTNAISPNKRRRQN